MPPSRIGILSEAISIASTPLQQRQSISLASFWQCPHFRSSRPEFFYEKSCLRPANLLKKRLWHKCFPVSFAKFLKTSFFTKYLQWLPLVFAPVDNIHSVASRQHTIHPSTAFIDSVIMFNFFLWWRMVERKTLCSHIFYSE